MTGFQVTSEGPIVDLGTTGPAQKCTLAVPIAPGTIVLMDRLDQLGVVGFRFVEGIAAEDNVVRLAGRPLAALRQYGVAAASVDVPDLPAETRATIARLGLLTAFANAGYFRPGTSGLVAAEQLVLTDLLSDAGFATGSYPSRLAVASAEAIIRFVELHPSSNGSLAARAARACLRHLPGAHPARSLLETLLADIPDPATVALWLELELASLIEIPSVLGGPSRGSRGAFEVLEWPVLWPERVRPAGLAADTAALRATADPSGQVLDVVLSPAPSDPTSPYPCARAVDVRTEEVLAVAPFFGDEQETRAHLYLDYPFEPDSLRIEVAALPDDPVLPADVHKHLLLRALALAYMRAQSLNDTKFSAEVLRRIGHLGRVAVSPNLGNGSDWDPLLPDLYPAGAEPQASSE